jgi:Pirin
MSWNPAIEPGCPDEVGIDAIETLIVPRTRDLGGFEVRRALPAPKRQMVGPFIFFDQAGPAEFLTGQGVDVRPHPHVGLGTVTYLFRGDFHHRDSTGADQTIRPGELNWMVAGRGVTHSERTSAAARTGPSSLLGIQTWVALPDRQEDMAPMFEHHGKEALPVIEDRGVSVRLILGARSLLVLAVSGGRAAQRGRELGRRGERRVIGVHASRQSVSDLLEQPFVAVRIADRWRGPTGALRTILPPWRSSPMSGLMSSLSSARRTFRPVSPGSSAGLSPS